MCLLFKKRQSLELSESLSSLTGDAANKELRDVLEREIDLRDQLKFTEEDLRRTQTRLHVTAFFAVFLNKFLLLFLRMWKMKTRS